MTEGDKRWITNWQQGQYMNRFYRKPKPETMQKNRESYAEAYKEEIKWLKENLQTLTEVKNSFLIDMYQILITGSRKVTPKMMFAIKNSIKKMKIHPKFNPVSKVEAEAKMKPMLEKIAMVERLAEEKGDRALEFVQSVKKYVQNNYRITRKQMIGLNKVYKRCSEDLFKGDDNETK